MPPSTRVSIVIPCHDQAHFLGDAMSSAARQTWPHLELVVVDDGSTDATADVARRAGAIVLQQRRAGVGAARNAGLAAATGEVVIFLDADDILESDAAESAVRAFDAHPEAAMAARCCVLIDVNGHALPTSCELVAGEGDLYPAWLKRNLVWTPGAAAFRREDLTRIGGFPVDIGPAADYAVYLTFARESRVVVENRPVVRYRQHAANMSRDAARMLDATMRVLDREAPFVPARYLADLREGRRTWCTFYGEQIIQGLRADVRAGELGSGQLRAASVLLRHCQSLALVHLVRKLRRVAAGRGPDRVEAGRFTPHDREQVGAGGGSR